MYKLLIKTDDFKALQACAGSKKDTREALKGVHITPEYIESTNGAQLLRVGRETSFTNAPAGVYATISAGKAIKGFTKVIIDKLDLEYPATDRVIPQTAGMASINIPLLDDALSITRAIINLHTYTGAAYSLATLERIAPLNGTWTAYTPPVSTPDAWKSQPLRLDYTAPDNTTYCAVIVPFVLKD